MIRLEIMRRIRIWVSTYRIVGGKLGRDWWWIEVCPTISGEVMAVDVGIMGGGGNCGSSSSYGGGIFFVSLSQKYEL